MEQWKDFLYGAKCVGMEDTWSTSEIGTRQRPGVLLGVVMSASHIQQFCKETLVNTEWTFIT